MASPEATDLQGHNEPCLRAFDFPPATANLLIQDSALLAKAIHFTTRGLFLRRDRHQKRTECLKPWSSVRSRASVNQSLRSATAREGHRQIDALGPA
jgi:hypothetical protein